MIQVSCARHGLLEDIAYPFDTMHLGACYYANKRAALIPDPGLNGPQSFPKSNRFYMLSRGGTSNDLCLACGELSRGGGLSGCHHQVVLDGQTAILAPNAGDFNRPAMSLLCICTSVSILFAGSQNRVLVTFHSPCKYCMQGGESVSKAHARSCASCQVHVRHGTSQK